MDESEIAVIVRLDEWIGSSLLYHKFKYQTTELQLFLQYVPVLLWYPLDMMIGTRTRIELSDCIFNAAVRNPLHEYSTQDLLVAMINILLEDEEDYHYEPSLPKCIEKLKRVDFQSFEKRKLKRLIIELVEGLAEVLKHEIKEPFQEEEQDCILIDNPLNDNEEFVLKTVKQNGYELQFTSDRLKDNEQIVLEAVKQNRFAFHFASNRLKDNEEFVEAVIKQDSFAFEYASDRLKDDEEFILKMILLQNNGYSLNFVSDRLKDNEEFILKAVKQYGYTLGCASNRLKDNEQIGLEAVKQVGNALCYVSYRLQDNEEVVLAAVKHNGFALDFVSDRLKDNEEVVLTAIKQNGNALDFAPDQVKDNEEIVLEAVKQSGGLALEYASDRLRNDFNFINEILKCCNSLQIFQSIAEKFRNIEFICYYIENYESRFHELMRKP